MTRQNDNYKSVDVMDLNDRRDLDAKNRRQSTRTRNPRNNNMNRNRRNVNDFYDEGLKAKRGRNLNKEFAIITYSFLILFICLTGYLIYFVQFESEDFINNSYNPRIAHLAETTIRGDIISSDGEVLATTQVDDAGNETRVYPFGNMYAHLVGYSINGMSGIEEEANYNLLRSNSFFLTKLFNETAGKKNHGDTVVTTVDSKIQSAAYNALGSNDGAVIAIEPTTGKVLAMVSKPDYDPGSIAANWDRYISDDDSSVLLNRATQGLYAPGSTFKMVTLMSYMNQNSHYDNFEFDCNGAYDIGDYSMHCYNGKAHGHENLMDAFGNSCNCAFSDIGLGLNVNDYGVFCDKLLFNQTLPTKLSNTAKSRFSLSADDADSTIAQTAIGQGQTMVSPLHMAMLASAIANDGLLMEPYVIDHTQNDQNKPVKNFKPSAYGQLIDSQMASKMREYMRYVVTDGTGSALNSDTYAAYGKTGTADFSSNVNENHSWFVGFAEDWTGRKIAVAVIMEGVSSGNSYAVPATKQIFDAYFTY